MGDEGSRDAPGSDVKNLPLPLPLGKEQRRQRVGAGPGNCLHPIAEKTGGRACGEAGGSTWSGPEAHQCPPSTWPLERLPRQTHLPRALGAATGGYCAGRRAGGRDRTPGNPDPRPCAPQGPPLPPAASCSSLFVCRGLHAQIELPFFFFFSLPSHFSSVPKFTPSVTSASAPPLLGSAFCLSGSPGSMGVCDDNNPRAYITLFVLQALGRRSLMKLRAGVRPRGRSGE